MHEIENNLPRTKHCKVACKAQKQWWLEQKGIPEIGTCPECGEVTSKGGKCMYCGNKLEKL
jgi:ribosomal protein L32